MSLFHNLLQPATSRPQFRFGAASNLIAYSNLPKYGKGTIIRHESGPVTTKLCKTAKADQHPVQQLRTLYGTRFLSKVRYPPPGKIGLSMGFHGHRGTAKCQKQRLRPELDAGPTL